MPMGRKNHMIMLKKMLGKSISIEITLRSQIFEICNVIYRHLFSRHVLKVEKLFDLSYIRCILWYRFLQRSNNFVSRGNGAQDSPKD